MVRRIADVAADLGLGEGDVVLWGRDRAKVTTTREPARRGAGRLVLVSAVNPTPAGEGKTTMSVGLAMALRRLGERAVVCLREPSLGPVFGVKGGGTGGGLASLHPADDINLHFTGDLHAVTSAHNLLSALVDNALHFGASVGQKGRLDARTIVWPRAIDMNDRSLRAVVVGLGRKSDGVPRQERFDITAASEVMAILALAKDQADLTARLERVVVGASESGEPVTAADLGAAGAMAALLRDALWPNLVQTLEGGPALVHAGPFANIAHGCSSLAATRLGLARADWTVTEAGFGFDLGGEKFLDIKCRALGAWPRLVVLVATLRALKVHGGATAAEAKRPGPAALEAGLAHLDRHLETLLWLGLPAVVAINRFPDDPDDELETVVRGASQQGVQAVVSDAFARGGAGSEALARAVVAMGRATDAAPPAPRYAYDLDDSLRDKIRKIASTYYGAAGVTFASRADKELERIEAAGGALLPCIAKTQYSLSHDKALVGRPDGFLLEVREVRLSAGAGFAVVVTGDIMTMPGLPKTPAAVNIRVEDDGAISGLMQGE